MAEEWRSEKTFVDMLLRVHDRSFMRELNNILEFWVNEQDRPVEQTSLSLLLALHNAGLHVGKDVQTVSVLPSILRKVNSTEDSSLQDRYQEARQLLLKSVTDDDTPFEDDIHDVDQLLLPALLGGSIPLTRSHANEVKKHVLRNDVISATKLQSVFATKDDTRFALRFPNVFQPAKLVDRLTNLMQTPDSRMHLYAAMKHLGCVGPVVFGESKASVPQGFAPVKNQSVALRYALYLDEQFESEAVL